jgi:hypothetical protein
MFLAWMSEACDIPEVEPRLLATETRGEQATRQTAVETLAGSGMEGDPRLGTRLLAASTSSRRSNSGCMS